MPFFRANGAQFSPCIISKAKHALGLKIGIRPINQHKCSLNYWSDACNVVGNANLLPQGIINAAIRKFARYIP